MPYLRGLLHIAIGVLVAASLPSTAAAQSQSGEVAPDTRATGTALQHLAGYAFVNYASSDGSKSFDGLGFNPIVHFAYRDQLLFEGELEITAEPDGETATELEYAAIDWFFSENTFLVAGKFLSPIGNFFQNLHPAWVNKLPTAPLGFGHDAAAPLTELGLQLRGGVATGEQSRLSYAVYVGNGPELEGSGGSEIEAIAADGFARDADKKKTVGGRIAWLPLPTLEIGASGAIGKAAVTRMDGADVTDDPARSYSALDADLWWRPLKVLELRGEFVRQKVGDEAASIAPMGGTWRAWYAQAAYRIGDLPWELVLRYGDYSTPSNADGQRQLTPGVVYYIAPQALVKLAYERNSGQAPAMGGMSTLENRLQAQLAYGF